WDAPRILGTFSVVTIIYGLVSPSILICLVPEIASAKFTSMDGFVSKLSARLQQAAFNNSALLTFITFWDCKKERELAFWREDIVTSSIFAVDFMECEIFLGEVTVSVSVLYPIKLITSFSYSGL